jgi:hypothetical protein
MHTCAHVLVWMEPELLDKCRQVFVCLWFTIGGDVTSCSGMRPVPSHQLVWGISVMFSDTPVDMMLSSRNFNICIDLFGRCLQVTTWTTG